MRNLGVGNNQRGALSADRRQESALESAAKGGSAEGCRLAAECYSIAGKVFVLGEYAILAGLPALVAAVPPRFSMKCGLLPLSGSYEPTPLGDEAFSSACRKVAADSPKPTEFHPESPISRLQVW